MKKLLLSAILFTGSLHAQPHVTKLAKTYFTDSDTIKYKISAYPETFNMVLDSDTLNHGTDTKEGLHITAFIGKDVLTLPASHYPKKEITIVDVQTPKGKKIAIFRFNANHTSFTDAYMNAYNGKVSYEHPEVYELANIIWALSPAGGKATDLNNKTEYFKKVTSYFKPFLNHPIFKRLNFSEADYFQNYLEFRENSFMYTFEGNKIVSKGLYNYVFGGDWDGFSNLFSSLLPLVQDFARQSDFRKFFAAQSPYYEKATARVKKLLPVEDMWHWLEKEFPRRKFNSYKIIYSPLIGGSHSTQQYGASWKEKDYFREAVMFICGADRYDMRPELTDKEREGLMSGIVFTEIDHNYVNPETNKYEKEVNAIFKPDYWSAQKSHSVYKTPVSIFNEYMTHALFCVWVSEYFDTATGKRVIEERESMNVDKRGFVRFRAFNQELMRLRKTHPGLKITALYPMILKWAEQQQAS